MRATDNNTDNNIRASEIGKRIAQSRREMDGMTQRELGDLVGVTERSVAAWELGEVIPYRHIRRLEAVLAKPAAWLLYGDEGAPVDIQQQLNDVKAQLEEVLKLLKRR
jgi:transcriptional regulator with XRE-family HTH domain